MSDIQNLINHMAAVDIVDDAPILDGKIHRCPTTTKSRKQNGWYIGWQKLVNGREFIYCSFGNWEIDSGKLGTFQNWGDDADNKKPVDASTIKQLEAYQAEVEKKAEQSKKRQQKAAAEKAAQQWLGLSEQGKSQYLEKKGVQGFGIRYGQTDNGGFVVVPLRDETGQITSLQTIFNDGDKRFLSGGRIKACCHIIGDISSSVTPLCFAEGYATAASIHQATGFPVVVCFNAGNLEPVIARFRADATIKTDQFIICADNDQWKPDKGNPGMDKANDAAKTHGCYIAVPVFDGLDTSSKPTDFNDLHKLAGLDAVKQAVMSDLNDDYAKESNAPKVITVSKENPEKPLETATQGRYPTEHERPCYRVYDDWLELSGSEKLRPGVYYHYTKEINGEPVPYDVWICSPLHVEAITHDMHKNNFGRYLKFKPTRGDWEHWAMPMAMLRGSCDELRGELLRMGVELDVKNKNALAQYLSSQHPKQTYEIATQTGWHREAFILPDRTIGSDAYFFQSEQIGLDIPYRQSGTLKEWQQHIARYCVGNPLLMLSVCAAFAGALLRPTHQQGGGFHVFGDSSQGKSTTLFASCSVWGDGSFKRSWRATSNGMEAAATLFNDGLLALDEISECDPKEVGNIIYALGNGAGKQRANRSGGARASAQWRVMVLSNGERSIEAAMMEAGKTPKAGQEMRLLNIPLFGQYGAFNELHDKQDGRELSDHLQTASKKYYGTAGVQYLKKLVEDDRDFGELLSLHVDDIKSEQTETLSGQVQRALKRFALVAMAGELATEYGVTGWQQGEATAGVIECFNQWLQHFGTGNIETRRALEAVKDFIDRYGDARFTKFGSQFSSVQNRAGYYDDVQGCRMYFFNNAGLSDALIDVGLERGIKALKAAGWLICDHNRSTVQRRVNGNRERFYCVNITENDDMHEKQAA